MRAFLEILVLAVVLIVTSILVSVSGRDTGDRTEDD